MSALLVYNWKEQFPGAPSEEIIRSSFLPAKNYRINKYIYPIETQFSGLMRGGTVFVIRGSCKYDFGCPQSVAAGQFAELPGGNYSFAATSDCPVELVLVWKLPSFENWMDQPKADAG